MRFIQKTLAAHLVLALSLSLAVACGGDDDGDNNDDLHSIMIANQGGIEVEMFSDNETLSVGRNLVYYKVTNNGEPVTTATVTQTPMMQMMDFAHSCPENDPTAASSDGLYEGMIVFIMPSGNEGTWSNTVTVVLDGETTETEVVFEDLSIAATTRRKSFSWQENEMDVTGFVSLNPDTPWAVGSNSYVMTVHKRQDMLNFPALTDISVDVTVTPTDGTATPATSPSYDAGGEHLGAIDLPAAGTYSVQVTVTQGGTELGTVAWEITI